MYDPNHALLLCRMMHFKEGLVFLYDKLRLYREVLQVCVGGEGGGHDKRQEWCRGGGERARGGMTIGVRGHH